jgi:hypothetical protein
MIVLAPPTFKVWAAGEDHNIFKAISLSCKISDASSAAIPYLARLCQESKVRG